MRADELVGQLKKVRARGPNQWMACCPAHQDRSASLSVKAEGDGRILLHCFAGCQPDEVLSAIGLTFADVMPERIGHWKPAKRPPIAPIDAIRIARMELTVIGIIASDVLQHKEIDQATWDRFAKAAGRIQEIAGWAD